MNAPVKQSSKVNYRKYKILCWLWGIAWDHNRLLQRDCRTAIEKNVVN